jgi:hypothetical protein
LLTVLSGCLDQKFNRGLYLEFKSSSSSKLDVLANSLEMRIRYITHPLASVLETNVLKLILMRNSAKYFTNELKSSITTTRSSSRHSQPPDRQILELFKSKFTRSEQFTMGAAMMKQHGRSHARTFQAWMLGELGLPNMAARLMCHSD